MIGVGSTVGNYQVLQKIGQGAMGSVFSAHHPRIGKKVALKVMNPELATNEEMLGRFFTEARAVTQIGHQNIVEVQDYGQTPEGESFIVMELLEGRQLSDVLKSDGAFSVQRALHVSMQLADGLGAAHQRGIIHRDLKPDNIMLVHRGSDQDFVKILDFGLAKVIGGGAGGVKTQTGSLLGTAHYMAPEQAESSKGIDHRVDVYALGCILFQILSGRVPFPGEGFGDVLIKHIREPPPLLSRLNPAVPKSIEKIVLHALAKKPAFRFATMEEFSAALRDPDRFMANMESSEMTPDEQMAKTLPPPKAAGFDDMPVTMTLPPSAPKQLPQSAATVMGSAPDPAAILAAQKNAAAAAAAASAARPGSTTGPSAIAQRMGPATLRPRKKSGSGYAPAIAVALGLVAAGGALGWFLLFGGDVHITIQTNPEAAEIFDGDKRLGTTPTTLKLARGSSPVSLSFRKEGYLTATRAVTPGSDETIKLRLLPKPDEREEPPPPPPPTKPVAAAPEPPPPPAPPPPKPVKPVKAAPEPAPARAPAKAVVKAPSKPKKPARKTESPLILSPSF